MSPDPPVGFVDVAWEKGPSCRGGSVGCVWDRCSPSVGGGSSKECQKFIYPSGGRPVGIP